MTHRASLSQWSCDTMSLKKYIILTGNLDNCVFFHNTAKPRCGDV
jgi:hypothetical protein